MKYKITLWKYNTQYCRTTPDKEYCTYTLDIEADSDYLAREKAIRSGGLPRETRDTPVIYEVIPM